MTPLNTGRDEELPDTWEGEASETLARLPIQAELSRLRLPSRLPRPASQMCEAHAGTRAFLPLAWLRGRSLSAMHTSPSHSAFGFRDHLASVTFLELTVALIEMETGHSCSFRLPLTAPHLQHPGACLIAWLEFESQETLPHSHLPRT